MAKFKYSGVFIRNKTDKQSVEQNAKGVMTQLYNIITSMKGDLANKILYWLNDWSGYILPNEKSFEYSKLIRYEQYSIIEANLGFKVGSEAGGLHYGVILDKNNAKGSKTVMIIPFKSLDEDETENDIDEKTEVYLGNQVFQVEIERQEKQLKKINTKLEKYDMEDDKGNYLLSKNDDEYKRLIKKKSFIETEISKMSKGTIAQVGQICLMSKMRIYYPTSVSEKLYKVTLSKENIQKIKEKFDELYF